MGLFDKVKNLFTEEIDEEPVVKREVRRTEMPKPVSRLEREPIKEEEKKVEEQPKEDKFVFFSDEDFKDLEKPKKEIKPEKRPDTILPYGGAAIKAVPEEKKVFKPSPIISPVYGVLDKNYTKDEILPEKVKPTYIRRSNRQLSVDDIRNKAYGTIEDELEDTLLGKTEFIEEDVVETVADIDIFEELEKYEQLDTLEETTREKKQNSDHIFEELDTKKEEILDELDNKKDEILDELDTKKGNILLEEEIDDLALDDETLELSKQLETQKRKLDELTNFIEDEPADELEEEAIENQSEDLNESELFDLIDSMYEKRTEE